VRAAGSGVSSLARLPGPATAQRADLADRDRRPDRGAEVLEHADRSELSLAAAVTGAVEAAEPHAVAGAQGAREHPDVGDLLAAGAVLDLEHPAGDRLDPIACPCREQLQDGHQGRWRMRPPTTNDTTADLIVIPSRRSSASEWVCVVPALTATDLVDEPDGVQQPLSERGLTGVYVSQDAQVERSSRQASYRS
jgi:hypothetical protein